MVSWALAGQPQCFAASAKRASAAAVPGGAGGYQHASTQATTDRLAVAVASMRGFCFYLSTFTLALPLFVTMLLLAPFVALFDRHRQLAQHWVNNIWAKVSTSLFYRTQVEGRENLPANDEPAVYVANHQSFLDIFSLFHLDRSFKFISKTSNFYIPIVGWSMFLTGHVMLNRMDRRSQLKCLGDCRELLQQGASVLFFPEGTRSKDGRMADFKKGAFSIAAKAGVPVVPVTLVGTGRLMPNGQESRLFGGGARVVVHPRIPPSKDADAMAAAARAVIAESLPAEQR
ncbi:hypothetical protein WJX81_001549 [Elliptochloris bilobata]|uniref:1-acyl-sn-glycerol-3-phosphate acyltransferase n=1 Tax=Elliptochloris bilobata TaxID=381761 RepID=A0AAW1SD97_9CHLO